ncbi:hypothetical protein BDZ45DRAFT_501641 [Acephala macrosclerotiorum]|nr:hypothetical protein BDZ45DRAFT_501641 [Acephala macrosclerotiorum]
MVHNEYIGPETPTSGIDSLAWPSPWILPVYVYPKAHNKGEAPVPNVAKCTIDTGNLQGNIVSREFVEDVLGYSVTDFHKLTKEEERGGTAITGDLHMPQGAIYLTWYHRNSTRVFRNMRFLVSPYGGCDLIIGARSIKQDKILNVPCLMNNIIIPETVSARPAGELHGKIWNIKNHITSTLQDDIDAKEEDGEDTRELDNRKRDLYAIYYAFSNILNILFGSGAENQDLDQKRSAADVEFGKIFTHPVSDMLKRELKLKEIEDGLKAELKYAQQIAPYDNNGDQNPNLRKRA